MIKRSAIPKDSFIVTELPIGSTYPQEDYAVIDDQYPIFAVADGVTLDVAAGESYPEDSGAAQVARIFCETAVVSGRTLYNELNKDYLRTIFRTANTAVGVYNDSKDRRKETLDYGHFDLFSTTAAFAAIQDDTLHWFSLCDSYVFVLNAGSVRMASPDPWKQMHEVWKKLKKLDQLERKTIIRRDYRNGIGKYSGYGVATGEVESELYLEEGTFKLRRGDVVVLCTDGFEPYFRLPEFISLLTRWPRSIQKDVRTFSKQMGKDVPEKFGTERTLLAILPY